MKCKLSLLLHAGMFFLFVLPSSLLADQPNFVFIIADDATYNDMECYGGQAKTPNMNKLCQQGMKFTHCFQQAPMCSPTRHAIYTAIYPVKSGAHPNHTFVKKGTKSVANYLRALGYRVALSGKTHIQPRESFPFEYLNEGKGFRKKGQRNNPNFKAIKQFLRQCKNKKTPFCLFACSNEPHSPWNKGDPSKYPPEKLKLPPYFVDTPVTRENFSRYLAEITYYDWQVGECVKLLDELGLSENTLVMVVSEQGNSFPFAKWTCYDMGLASGMIVRWPGRVRPGSTTDAMVEYVDIVPTFLEAAGGKQPTEVDGRSFLPVLLGKAKEHKKHVYGLQTSRGIINGPKGYGIRTVRSQKYRYIINLDPKAKFKNAVFRSQFWKSWVEKAEAGDKHAKAMVNRYEMRPAEELYDVTSNRNNMKNVANDPQLAEVKRDLRQRLQAWMELQGDRGQATELLAHTRQWRNRKKKQK
ncbi:MAG: sulfatase [Gemmataceae bacterium]